MKSESSEIQMNILQEKGLLIGTSLMKLPEDLLFSYGAQVSEALACHKDTMLQYSPAEIVSIIREGRGVIVVEANDCQICASFAQVSPWKNQVGNVLAVEFRSWKSWSNGKGLIALYGGILLSQQLYPSVPMYAVVEESNSKAQQKLLSAGARPYQGMPQGMKIELHEGDAKVNVFDLTSIQLEV